MSEGRPGGRYGTAAERDGRRESSSRMRARMHAQVVSELCLQC